MALIQEYRNEGQELDDNKNFRCAIIAVLVEEREGTTVRIKSVLVITIIIILVVSMIFTAFSCQRYNENILMEMVEWPGGGSERNSPIYYFVVTNDGILISYFGLSRSGVDHPRRHNFIRSVQEREEITLSEEDFRYISELVYVIVSGNSEGEILTNSHVMFLHNGNIYVNSTTWSFQIDDLFNLFFDLTSFLVD